MKYFFQTISWNAYFTIASLCKLRRNVHDILFETFMKCKNSENRFSEFSLSWKTLLLNLFPCLINPFVSNGVYKSLKENVSITLKASEVVLAFWEAVVQRCSVKKVLKKKDPGTGVFLFYRTPLVAAFVFYITKFEGYWR